MNKNLIVVSEENKLNPSQSRAGEASAFNLCFILDEYFVFFKIKIKIKQNGS